MRRRELLLVVPLLWAAGQACTVNKEATGTGQAGLPDARADHSVDAPAGDGQAGAGGVAGAGGIGGASGSAGTGGLSPTLCAECPASQCSPNEACVLLAGGGASGAADAGVDGNSGQAGADAAAADAGDASVTDAGSAPKAACLTRCDLASPSCPAGFTCKSLGGNSPVCYPDDPAHCVKNQPDGGSCSSDWQCSSDHCDNGFCCASGACCAASADCPGSTATCADPAKCQGTRTGQICQSHQCVAGNEDDDSACGPSLATLSCGTYQDVACTGAVDQTGLACATSCIGDAECLAPATCNLGHCCAPGTFDFDGDPTTCECASTPLAGQGTSCNGALDLGDLVDTGQSVAVSANLLPDREIWYRFHAVDTPDTSCDKYHVRIHFLTNPASGYQFLVFRGTCSNAECASTGGTDYEWATDMRQQLGGVLTGQCPCTAPAAAPLPNVSTCEDDSADYFIEVKMKPGYTPANCDEYVLEMSNGLYSTP